jgi:hypothetical protein
VGVVESINNLPNSVTFPEATRITQPYIGLHKNKKAYPRSNDMHKEDNPFTYSLEHI